MKKIQNHRHIFKCTSIHNKSPLVFVGEFNDNGICDICGIKIDILFNGKPKTKQQTTAIL